MFRDKDEELARLEEELLEEDVPEEETPEEETAEEEPSFLEEPSGDTREYKNFANDYGKVNVYNTDTSDIDLEKFSEEVYQPKEKHTGLLVLAASLLAGIFLVLAWWVIRFLGVV